MRVISFSTIREFFDKEPRSAVPLKLWFKKVQKAKWDSFSEMKNTFNSADPVGNQRYVFDIAGNHYRLVAKVLFNAKIVYIRFVGDHNAYNKIRDIKNI